MKTKLIVGLGNPGEQYQDNRHNVGFKVLDAIAKSHNLAWKKKRQSVIGSFTNADTKYVLAKPQTFMNNSGEAVQELKHFYKLENSDITVVHDELDLPFGTIRVKSDGGSAGHKGVQSIIDHIGADFNRVRIGIDTEQTSLLAPDVFVLSNFTKTELEQLKPIIKQSIQQLT